MEGCVAMLLVCAALLCAFPDPRTAMPGHSIDLVIIVAPDTGHARGTLELQRKVGGIDICSFGGLKWTSPMPSGSEVRLIPRFARRMRSARRLPGEF